MSKPFYVTTPIYYVTDKPHIGHLYTTVAADIIARYHRLIGDDVWFLTGTDEHGQKIEKKARENNETPRQMADRVVERYREAWKKYDIQYDDFIRTTEERHTKLVQEYIARLMKTGDIYLDTYEGWYCVPDERYLTETEVVDGKCPDCGRPVEKLREESYFFKMSAYQEKLREHILKNPNFIMPDSRKNEVLGFIQQGLRDISVSRTTITWGIPMPKDTKASKEHKVYVWFDALTNYLSALAPLDGSEMYNKFWPEVRHLVGKDILRFHAVYWPTFLMALGLPVPKQIIAHGWLTEANRKISKSTGNAIDPIALADKVGVDGMRYFLFREFVFGQDGEYTEETMYRRINSDLANDYGNCLSRTCSMILKYFGEAPMPSAALLALDSEPKKTAAEIIAPFHQEMTVFGYHKALEQVSKLIGEVNKYIDTSAPWALAKSDKPEDKQKLAQVLVHCHESLRIATVLLHPFIPTSTLKAAETLGTSCCLTDPTPLKNRTAWGSGTKDIKVNKPSPLFPRLEYKPPQG